MLIAPSRPHPRVAYLPSEAPGPKAPATSLSPGVQDPWRPLAQAAAGPWTPPTRWVAGVLGVDSMTVNTEIELVEISELLLVRGIHRVEPVHELVNDRVSELVVELFRQLRRDRHASPRQSRRYHNLRSARDRNSNPCHPGSFHAVNPVGTTVRRFTNSSLRTAPPPCPPAKLRPRRW